MEKYSGNKKIGESFGVVNRMTVMKCTLFNNPFIVQYIYQVLGNKNSEIHRILINENLCSFFYNVKFTKTPKNNKL